MFCNSARTAGVVVAETIAIGGFALPASAQDGGQNGTNEQLLACDGLTDLTERLVCFNSVVDEQG